MHGTYNYTINSVLSFVCIFADVRALEVKIPTNIAETFRRGIIKSTSMQFTEVAHNRESILNEPNPM